MRLEQMERLCGAAVSRIGRAWLEAVAHLRRVNTEDAIAVSMYGYQPITGIADAGRHVGAAMLAVYTDVARSEANYARAELAPRRVRKRLLSLDLTDPPALKWAQLAPLDKIREIDEDTRRMIREALIDGARSGVNPREVARTIRESIGLTDYQTRVVANYRRQLESGQYSAALARELSHGASDKTIAAALRNGGTLTQAQIDKAVERYRDNWLRFRAEAIGRTEGLRAAHQGSDELYRQAIARGDLRADQLERTWHHSPGAKRKQNERAWHVAMNGMAIAWGEKFRTALGNELAYPCDPQAPADETVCCRCVVTTTVRRGNGATAEVAESESEAMDAAQAAEEGEGAAAAEDAAADEDAATLDGAVEDAAAADAMAEDELAAEDAALSADVASEEEIAAAEEEYRDTLEALAAAQSAHDAAEEALTAAHARRRR